jgi:thiol-disulfide isomerase/thioredoxin
MLCSAVVLLSCGPSLPPSQHALLEQAPESLRGWRVEQDHVGEWVPVPEPSKVTVIDFWSTSCEPCIRAMPELERLWSGSDRNRVQVLGVAIDDEPAEIQRMLPTLGVTFPMLIDSAGALSGAYKVGGSIPATFVLDRQGRVRFFSGGAGGIDEVADAIEALLAE